MNVDINHNQLSEHEFECIQAMYSKAKAQQCKVLEIFKYKDFFGKPTVGLKVMPPEGLDSSAIFIIRSTDED